MKPDNTLKEGLSGMNLNHMLKGNLWWWWWYFFKSLPTGYY
jgi:hypothetical protein